MKWLRNIIFWINLKKSWWKKAIALLKGDDSTSRMIRQIMIFLLQYLIKYWVSKLNQWMVIKYFSIFILPMKRGSNRSPTRCIVSCFEIFEIFLFHSKIYYDLSISTASVFYRNGIFGSSIIKMNFHNISLS